MASRARWTLGEIADLVRGELHGPADLPVSQPVPADSDDPMGICFAEAEGYLAAAEASGVGAVLLPRGMTSTKPYVSVESPRSAFGRLLLAAKEELPIDTGVHPTAVVSPEAFVDPTASVGAYCVIERGAQIGERARVYAFTYVGEGCRVGEDAVLFPHVVLYQDVEIGARTVVHASTVLGADGFGYGWDGRRRIKIPHVGGVRIGEDVEIGAISAVDRATAGTTEIGRGTKLDNLVQVAHNVQLGEDCAIASLSGLSGSSRIGNRVVMGGQCATSHHITVGDDISLGGRTGVLQDITEPGEYLGLPARPMREAMRAIMTATKLPDLMARLRRLEKKVGE